MSTTLSPTPTAEAAEEKAGKSKMLIVGVLLLAVAGGAAWFLFLKPSAPAEPKAGEVAPLEAIQVNLSGGHYLRLGMALQLTEKAHEVDGSKALDAAITVFSGLAVGEVNKPEVREDLRHKLLEVLHERYHGDVMDVYFTEYVTQ